MDKTITLNLKELNVLTELAYYERMTLTKHNSLSRAEQERLEVVKNLYEKLKNV